MIGDQEGEARISSLPPPPVFGSFSSSSSGVGSGMGHKSSSNSGHGLISLDDIFDEFIFDKPNSKISSGRDSNHGESHNSGDGSIRSSSVMQPGRNLDDGGVADDRGDDGYDSMLDDDDDDDDDEGDGDGRRKKRSRGLNRNMTEEQKVERRERNREHAKRSRVRKKFLLESLQQSVRALQEENEKLKSAIRENLNDDAEHLLASCSSGGASIIATDPNDATKTLDDPDYRLVKALQTAQQNFVISDPSLPDNPIVYASTGFLRLSGYSLDQVLGRNCRFLQGPETDPRAVDRIRKGIEKGEDTTVVLLNYRNDGSTFWNQFFVAALRDGDGNVVNYLGVQCKVSADYAKAFESTST